VSGQLHAPAVSPPSKEPPAPIGYEAGWAPEAGMDAVDEDKNSQILPGIEPRSS
jgi:hypothetical protein